MTSAEEIKKRVATTMSVIDQKNAETRQLGDLAYIEYKRSISDDEKGSSCLPKVLGALLLIPTAAVIFDKLI